MIEINSNTWIIPNHLDVFTAPEISKKYTKQPPSNKEWILDFSKCTKVDCAGLAMIIDCIKVAKRMQIHLTLIKLSSDALFLVKAHGLEEIISKHIKQTN